MCNSARIAVLEISALTTGRNIEGHPEVTNTGGRALDVIGSLDLANGPLDATLTLKSGLLTEKATATLEFPEAGQSTQIEPDQGLGLLWPAILAALLVMTALIVLLRTTHRHKVS